MFRRHVWRHQQRLRRSCRDYRWWSDVSLSPAWPCKLHSDSRPVRRFEHRQRRFFRSRTGQMEDVEKLYAQLWPAVGCPTLSGPGHAAVSDFLWRLPQRPKLPFEWQIAQPEQGIPAARWIRMG